MAPESEAELGLPDAAPHSPQNGLAVRRRAEEELRHQAEWLRITLASIGDAVIVIGADGRVTLMNAAAEALTAWSQADALGQRLQDVFHIVHESTRQPVDNPALRALQEGTAMRPAHHTILQARNGEEHPIDDSAVPILGESGATVGAVLIFRDASERKVSDHTRAHLAAIVEQSQDAIVSKTLQGTILSWNKGAEGLFGYTPDEAIGRPISMLLPRERGDEERGIIARIARGERIEHFETVRLSKAGRRIDISLTVSPIRDGSNEIVGASKIARDISRRKAIEARDQFLIALDDALRPMSEVERIIPSVVESLGRHLAVNRCVYAAVEDDQDTFELTTNYTSGVESIVGRFTVSQFGQECLRLMRLGEPYVVTDCATDARVLDAERPAYAMTAICAVLCVPILKQGRFVAAMAVHAATPRAWDAGEIALVQQVASRCWESIERVRVTDELRESEHQFRALANSIANLAWMAHPDGWIYWYNDQWFSYTGTTPAEMDGWGWQRVHDPVELPIVIERWRSSIATGTPFEMVFPLRSADGVFRRFLTRVNPVRDSRGQVVRWFGTNTDVENECLTNEANAELRARAQAARQEAESANRAKDEFLAMLGHELRNPLSPIVTALHLMKLRGGDGTERERTVIERQVSHLTRLVDDLLDVSRIARGKVELKEEIVEMAEVVARAVEIASPLLEQRSHNLALHVPRLGLAVKGDAIRLSQVLSNLVTNAAKYTSPGGHITIRAHEHDGQVVVSVRDTGMGISPEILPRVFDLFAQEGQAIDRSQGGLGLGLTIVKSLVERHGGTVSAHSDGPTSGSEFIVRLPKANLARAADGEPPPASTVDAVLPATAGLPKVLIVDDSVDGAEMLAAALRARGYQTRTAFDAPAALRLAEEFLPDIAFLDLGLPVMDGYELAAHLRALPALDGMTLVALTGYGQPSDRQRTSAAGFQHHLVKPVDLAAIELILLDR